MKLARMIAKALVAGAIVVIALNSFAQETRRVPSMSELVYKKLTVVGELVQPEDENVEPDFKKGLEELNDINTSKFNKYELASVYQYYGYIYYSLDRVEDAIKNYKLVLAQSPEIAIGMEQTTYKTIAQLYLMTEKYTDAIGMYKKYMEMTEIVSPEDYYYLAQCYYATNDLGKTLENVNIAVKMYEDSNRIPKESWYDLQRAMYYEREDIKTVIQILEKMVKHYNKGKYWYQLGGMYGTVDRNSDQLQAYNTAYVMGALDKERDLLNLAYLNFDAEYPYKAAQVLEKGIKDGVIPRSSKNLETLGTALRLSQEIKRSIPIIEEAAGKADDGNLYAQLAGTYFQADAYDKAITAAENAAKLKGLRSPGNLYMTMGMSQFYLDNFDDAIKSFREAAKDKSSEKNARQWIQYAQSEKDRKAKLAES